MFYQIEAFISFDFGPGGIDVKASAEERGSGPYTYKSPLRKPRTMNRVTVSMSDAVAAKWT